MNSRLLSLGKAAFALTFAGCVQAAAPNQGGKAPTAYDLDKPLQPVVATTTITGGSAPAHAPSPFRNEDGSPKYEALLAHFGAPNENIVLNPRAVDVAQTPSLGSIKIESDGLVFDAANAGWLAAHVPGDTLYCGHGCGSEAFNRKIVAMRTTGGKIYVETKQGQISDIVHHGWLHTSQLVTFDDTEEQKAKILHDGRGVGISSCSGSSDTISICFNSGDISKDIPNPHYTKTWSQFTKAFPGGSIGVTPTVTLWLTFDIDVEVGVGANLSLTNGVSLDPVFDLNELSVTANFDPSLLIQANYNLDKSWSDNWTLVNISGADGGPESSPITLGPLTIDTSALIVIKAEADASAAVALNAIVTVSDNLSAGIGYTYSLANGGNLTTTPPKGGLPTPQLQIQASGNAAAHASASLNLSLGVTVNGFGLSLGGPSIAAQAAAGVSLSAKASNQNNSCNLTMNGEGYYSFSGNADLDIGIEGIGFNYPYTFPTENAVFPTGGWTFTKSVPSTVCSNGNFDAGGQQMCVISGHEQLCPTATPQCCPTGTATENACVNEQTDSNNCGVCNLSCTQFVGTGSTCMTGTCSCTCPSTSTMSGLACPGGNVAGCF